MRKFLEKSSHDAVITVFILAQKGKMAFKTPFVPRELKRIHNNTNLISPSKKNFLIQDNFLTQDNPICQKTDIPRDKTIKSHDFVQRVFNAIDLQNDVSEQSCGIIDGMYFIRKICDCT